MLVCRMMKLRKEDWMSTAPIWCWIGCRRGEEYSSLTKGHMMIMTDARHLPGLDDPLFLPGKPVVNFQTVDSCTGRTIEDKMEIRLFNLRYEGVDAAGDLAHDFRQTDPEKMRNGFLKSC